MSREEEYEEMIDNVDAGIFSGELLWTNFDMLKECVERWTDVITSHEELLDDIEMAKQYQEIGTPKTIA